MKRKLFNIDHITKYLLEEDKSKEKEMIDKLIQDDEKSRRDFDAYIELWEKSADVKDYETIDTGRDWQKVRSRLHFSAPNKRISFRNYALRIAAVLILALFVTLLFTRIFNNSSSQKTYYYESIASNDIKTVELPDGTTINLNKNSKIIHNSDYGKNNRDVILEGEAFFNVARNENMPFRVHTLNSIVEVLGTSFDIKADSELVVVGVLTGKVAFYESKNTQNRVDLLPQHTGYYNAVSNTIVAKDSFDPNEIAWHTGLFVFNNKPLQETFQSVATIFDLNLRIEPDIILADSIRLSFKGHNLQDILINLNIVLSSKNIEVEANNDQLIVRRP
jgi:transmembrane sensor